MAIYASAMIINDDTKIDDEKESGNFFVAGYSFT